MITIADYSRLSKFKYNQGVLLARKMKKKKDICIVQRVDKVKKNIDLSKRKKDPHAIKDLEIKFAKGKKVQSFFYPLCDKFEMDMIEFYEMIVFPL